MHMKFERLLSKSLTTLVVKSYYLVVHTGPDLRKTAVLCTKYAPRTSKKRPTP